MKRLLLILFLLLGTTAAFATSVDAVLLSTSFTPTGGSMEFFLSNPSNEGFPVQINFTGVDVLSLACANATCTRLSSDVLLSAFKPTVVIFKNQYYQVYLLGSLDFTNSKFSLAVTGTLTACLEQDCSSGVMFNVDVSTQGYPRIVARNDNGTLTLLSATDVVPEPSTVASFGTGFTLLACTVRRRRGRQLFK